MPYPLYWPRSGMPHGFVCDTPVHLVYRLHNCLPVGILRELSDKLGEQLAYVRKHHAEDAARIESVKAEYFLRYDELLDACDQSKYILMQPETARIVLDSWRFLHERRTCRLIAVCVMGNHVHVLLRGWPETPMLQLGDLVRTHKSFSANEIVRAELHSDPTSSKVWSPGFFDRYVRPGRLEAVLEYILQNPVKAGLIRTAAAWPHTLVM